MNRMMKGAAIAALVGAAALASVTQSEARNRWIGPAAAGFAAGAIVGSAASGAYAYSPGYAYSSGYYEPGYAYAPAYTYQTAPAYDAYAYEAAPVYVAPRYYRGRSGSNGCYTQGNYGQSVDESACSR
jgi:hypothetical protein